MAAFEEEKPRMLKKRNKYILIGKIEKYKDNGKQI